MEKAPYKLVNTAACGKAMENLRERIDARLVSNKNS